MIIINLKNYRDLSFKRVRELIEIVDSLAKDFSELDLGVALTYDEMVNLTDFKENSLIKFFAQYLDREKLFNCSLETGCKIGDFSSASDLFGVLLDHKDYPISRLQVRDDLDFLREKGLDSCLCIESVSDFVESADFYAFELHDLIGSDISALDKYGDQCIKLLREMKGEKVLLGAGISNAEDVRRAVEMGFYGVLLSSAFVFAKDPRALLFDMLSEMSKIKRKSRSFL